MHNDYEEFAIHWVPKQGSLLAEFGAGWTGWCAERGMRSDLDAYRWMRRGCAEAPGTSALHGLHAPLKAPFRLASGQSFWALDHDLLALAETLPTARLPRFEVTVLDGRVVLALSRPSRSVLRLISHIADAVRPFEMVSRGIEYTGDHGLGEVDLPGMAAWTRFDGASVAQFHIPLTDRMELGRAFDLVDSLTPEMNSVLAEDSTMVDLALMGNPGRGRPWRLIERYALSDEPHRRALSVPRGMACNGPELFAPLNTGLAFV